MLIRIGFYPVRANDVLTVAYWQSPREKAREYRNEENTGFKFRTEQNTGLTEEAKLYCRRKFDEIVAKLEANILDDVISCNCGKPPRSIRLKNDIKQREHLGLPPFNRLEVCEDCLLEEMAREYHGVSIESANFGVSENTRNEILTTDRDLINEYRMEKERKKCQKFINMLMNDGE